MNILLAFFASTRYWNDADELQAAYAQLRGDLASISNSSVLISQEADLAQLAHGDDCLVIVPMSGAVQRLIIAAAEKYRTVLVYPAYIQGNAAPALGEGMLKRNAAPTTMDCWAVLRRTHAHAAIALRMDDVRTRLKVFGAYLAMQGATLLLIGDTEPWVISNSADKETYKRLGVTVRQVPQSEVAQAYRAMTDADAAKYYRYFKGDEKQTVEPTDADIRASARMAAALEKTLEAHHADGAALACFNLLAEGTNCCLGVSYINDLTPYVVSCEGDVDSAVTMLAMKHLASTKLWMANPGLHPDGTINFSHCTAPLDLTHQGKCPYILRNHHESGIGTSLQVEYPVGHTVTACRISDDARKMTIHKGTTVAGAYECACRTQVYVQFEDFTHYLNTVLGCHQVFAFEDIMEEMRLLGEQLQLEVL